MKSERPADALRLARIQRKVIPWAEGSALITLGRTKVLCAATVEQGKPKWMRNEAGGWITAEYSLLPRSTMERTRRERGGNISGRTMEIQRLIGRALRAVADLSLLEGLTIIVDCDVIQADGGTRTAAITGGYVALHDACSKLLREKNIAQFPLRDQVAAVSVGIVEGKLWLDLDYQRDAAAEVDMNVVMTGNGGLVEIQGTAERKPFNRDQLEQLLILAGQGISRLLALQKKVLRLK